MHLGEVDDVEFDLFALKSTLVNNREVKPLMMAFSVGVYPHE